MFGCSTKENRRFRKEVDPAPYPRPEPETSATPRNIGDPERAARQRMPYDLYAETVEKVAANYDAARRRQRITKGR